MSGLDVCAVIVPAAKGSGAALPRQLKKPVPAPTDLPVITPWLQENIIHLAWEHQIPVWEVGRLSAPKTLEILSDLQPDLAAVACFSRFFPPQLLELPRFGCLNLHPSLLPAYRGPEPLFWIAYHDERETGVTLHFLDEGVDSGDIVAQSRIARPDGLSAAKLEQQCAAEGALLLLSAVQQLDQQGTIMRRKQAENEASYFPSPGAEDFVIPGDWPARRAFNFLRGAKGWPLHLKVGDDRFRIRVVKSYSSEHSLGKPYLIFGDELWVQFNPGVLRALAR